jgi:hypothetical protein
MLTAETITDEQIRTLRNTTDLFCETWWTASQALRPMVDSYGQCWSKSIRRARAACAELLNGR